MGPSHRAFARNLEDAFEADGRAHPGEHLRHLLRPPDPPLTDACELFFELLVRRVDEVTQDVNLCAGDVRVDLDPGNHFEATGGARCLSFGHPSDRVVIRDREHLQAEPARALNELGRGKRTVRRGRVGMEVDFVQPSTSEATAGFKRTRPASANSSKYSRTCASGGRSSSSQASSPISATVRLPFAQYWSTGS